MQCPNDGATLVMSERSGVEIDYCPSCRGVWLDRGELDKIIDRAGPQQPQAAPQANQGQPGLDPRQHRGYGNQPSPRKKKRENWLSELFD